MVENNILYHYCSLEVLISIIENKCLWFSDLLESNDKMEDNLLFQLYYEFLKNEKKVDKINKKYKNRDIEFLSRELDKARKQTAIYGLSLTDRYDNLYHWMTYGKNNGICIGFDKNELLELANNISGTFGPAKFQKISYVKNYLELSDYFNRQLKRIEEFKELNVLHYLLADSPLFKENDWSSESEQRLYIQEFIVKAINGDFFSIVKYNGDDCALNHIMKNGIPVFHYEIPIDLKIIKQVLISPFIDLTETKLRMAFNRLHQRKEIIHIEIKKSKIGVLEKTQNEE